jgi:hypothetical protein
MDAKTRPHRRVIRLRAKLQVVSKPHSMAANHFAVLATFEVSEGRQFPRDLADEYRPLGQLWQDA